MQGFDSENGHKETALFFVLTNPLTPATVT